MDSVINIGLYAAYVLLGLAILSSLVLPLINSLNDPKTLIKAGVGIGIMVVLYLISWSIAGSEVNEQYITMNVNESLSKIIGGALTMMYFLFFLAIAGIIYTEISKIIK